MSLYRLAREGDVDRLKDRLGSDSSAVRRRAAELLGELCEADDSHVVELLVRRATADEDGRVRGAAVDALATLGGEATEALLAALTGAEGADGTDGADGADASRAAAGRYARALSADLPELRMAAANALGRLGETSAAPRLARASEDPDPRVRLRVCAALGRLGDPRSVGALTGRLEDESTAVRTEAANALGAAATEEAFDVLLTLLEDDDETLRRIAAGALGRAGDPRPVGALAAALGDESAAVRRAAVYSVIELLSNAPTDRSHRVRETILAELRSADAETVVEPLVEILEESLQNRRRRNAAWFLGRVAGGGPDGSVARALAAAMESDDGPTAQFAATSLSTLGGPTAEEALLDLLDRSRDDEVRAKATFVLGRVGGPAAAERLDALTEDESEEVRRRAFSAVTKRRGRR